MLQCEWLPDLLYNDSTYSNLENYDNAVYSIFRRDFLDNPPSFRGESVKIKTSPLHNGKEEAYYHITSKDYYHGSERDLDIFRCQRIRWVKALIEHCNCYKTICRECSGVKTWDAIYKNKVRSKILLAEERYLVVLEKRKGYYLLITAFYVDNNRRLKKLVEEYEQTKSAPYI